MVRPAAGVSASTVVIARAASHVTIMPWVWLLVGIVALQVGILVGRRLRRAGRPAPSPAAPADDASSLQPLSLLAPSPRPVRSPDWAALEADLASSVEAAMDRLIAESDDGTPERDQVEALAATVARGVGAAHGLDEPHSASLAVALRDELLQIRAVRSAR